MMNKTTCTIKILDEVNCVFVGLHPDHVGYFYETYGFHAPNYFFNPKFKLGSWDGKIRFFHKTGKTYVYLLDEIIPRVIDLGYKIKIIDNRQEQSVIPSHVDEHFLSHITNPETGEPWKMRSYQVELVNALIDAGGGVGIAGTGAGKTSCTAVLALAYENAGDLRSIIIVPDKNLTDQTRREYEFFGLDVGEYSGTNKDLNHQHIVSTWQALKNNPKVLQSFNVVIVDECHGLRGNTLLNLLNEYGKNIVFRFGVTGTMPKEKTDAFAVKISVGPVRYQVEAHQLIEQGYLAKLHIDIFQLEVDLQRQYQSYLEDCLDEKPATYRKFKDTYFPDWSAEKSFLQTENTRLQWIADYISIKRDAKKGNVLCLVDGIKFGKKLAALIPDAVFLHGKDPIKERRQVYEMFKTTDNMVVIATTQIASTGLDIKRIFNLIYIDVGKSFIRVIQTIGRGLRKAVDKDHVRVTDICSDLKYGRKHLTERCKYYKEAKYPYKKTSVKYTEE
jgi:superfamily II DNA or RNA helicase